jgi:hypothetical protein
MKVRCTCEANATERTYGPFLGRPTHNRKGRRATGPWLQEHCSCRVSVFLFSSSTKAVPYFGAREATISHYQLEQRLFCGEAPPTSA